MNRRFFFAVLGIPSLLELCGCESKEARMATRISLVRHVFAEVFIPNPHASSQEIDELNLKCLSGFPGRVADEFRDSVRTKKIRIGFLSESDPVIEWNLEEKQIVCDFDGGVNVIVRCSAPN